MPPRRLTAMLWLQADEAFLLTRHPFFAGSYEIAATDTFCSGTAKGEAFLAGALTGDAFHSGTSVGQANG